MIEKMRERYMEALALAYFSLAGTPSGAGRTTSATSPVEFGQHYRLGLEQ